MRGKAQGVEAVKNFCRITPAYAGKRSFPHGLVLALRDHPRLCGEKCGQCPKYRIQSGSPPPMRGKDKPLQSHDKRMGITPAYAGKRLHVHKADDIA